MLGSELDYFDRGSELDYFDCYLLGMVLIASHRCFPYRNSIILTAIHCAWFCLHPIAAFLICETNLCL